MISVIRPYQLSDLFPDCCLPKCETQSIHQHILTHQQAILDASTKYLYVQGGVGSAKSIALAAKTVHLSLSIPGNEGVVCRKHFGDLFKSSWRDVKKCIDNLVNKKLIPAPSYAKKTQGDYTQITFHNGSILYAIQGKDWSKGLGSSYGLFWIDDAMESYEELFIGDETNAGLLSRLRMPNVHYDKKTYNEETREHGSLHGMVSSNPPPVGHWLHKLFGSQSGQHKIGNDTVSWIQTATYENPFVGADYAMGLMAVQSKMGRSKNVARRVIFGESIPAYGGIKVFPEFEESRHVTVIPYDNKIPIVRGWDFGFHHPAVIFSHLDRCEYGTNHYKSLSEVVDHFSLNIWDFYKEVKKQTDLLYKDAKLILDAGDRAGYRKSASNKDNRGDMRILREEYHLPFKFRFLDLEHSLNYMRGLLNPKKPCLCGEEIVLIDVKCKVLIGALQGGYKYAKSRDGKASDKPVEDRYFADTACAWRYGAENFVKWGIPHEYRESSTEQDETPKVKMGKEPWAWMEMSDSEMGKLLTR